MQPIARSRVRTLLRIATVFIVTCLGSCVLFAQDPAPVSKDAGSFLTEIRQDLSSSNVSKPDLNAFCDAISSILQSAHRPDPADLKNLQTAIEDARASGHRDSRTRRAIRTALQKAMHSAGVTDEQMAAVKSSAMEVFQPGTLPRPKLEKLLLDLKSLLNNLPERRPQS